jgi:hypothetical protein
LNILAKAAIQKDIASESGDTPIMHRESERKTVVIECANPDCQAGYRAVLADHPPKFRQVCLECDTPFDTVQGQHVYYLYAPAPS